MLLTYRFVIRRAHLNDAECQHKNALSGASGAHPKRVKSCPSNEEMLLLCKLGKLHLMADSDNGGGGASPKASEHGATAPPGRAVTSDIPVKEY